MTTTFANGILQNWAHFFFQDDRKKDTEDNICRLKFFHLLAQINQN